MGKFRCEYMEKNPKFRTGGEVIIHDLYEVDGEPWVLEINDETRGGSNPLGISHCFLCGNELDGDKPCGRMQKEE